MGYADLISPGGLIGNRLFLVLVELELLGIFKAQIIPIPITIGIGTVFVFFFERLIEDHGLIIFKPSASCPRKNGSFLF